MTLNIEVEDLHVRYGSTTAVEGVSFDLQGAGIHGLIGRNGSGKTSLLSVLAGFRKASAGQVRVGGQPVFENPDAAGQTCFIRGAGDTVESDWPSDRVKDALKFASDMRPGWDADYAEALVDRFQLPAKKRLGELSRGQRSAVGIVLGMASRAPLTIFDESYLGLDAPARYAFYDEIVSDFVEHPRTFVISTHLIEEIASLFEDVVIIDEGRVVLHEPAEELRSRGVTITGPAERVDNFINGLAVLAEQRLGNTKSVSVYGALDDSRRSYAQEFGLELGPIGLQDLFVHLTDPARRSQ